MACLDYGRSYTWSFSHSDPVWNANVQMKNTLNKPEVPSFYVPTLIFGKSHAVILNCRAWLDWQYELPDWTGPDTQIFRTGPAGPDWIWTYFLKYFTFQIWFINSHKISPESVKENVRFLDSLDFENLTDFRTGLDVW